ncbi:MAG: hypothetical protein JWQ11_934, partial [Rhizobacter sp.]|nr:hypothetical protein [Rhizobacter sp.]
MQHPQASDARYPSIQVIRVSRVLAGLAGLIGGVALATYLVEAFTGVSWIVPLRQMSPLTATALLALAGACLDGSRQRRPLMGVFIGVAFALVAAVAASYVLAGGDELSPWITQAMHGRALVEGPVGRTAIATLLCLFLLAASVLIRREGSRIADGLAAGSLAISALALLGYAYETGDVFSMRIFRSMALPTASALFMLSLSAMTMVPETGWAAVIGSGRAASRVTRRQLLFTLIPPVAGWLLLRWLNEGALGTGAAMGLLVVVTVLPLGLLVLRDGRTLLMLDIERQANADMQTLHGEELEAQLAAQAAELRTENSERTKAEATLHQVQRMEAVGQLTGGIAHDFNNLLMAISGNLQLLDRRLEPGLPARKYVTNAMAATDKGAKVTAQLLAFSRSQRLTIAPFAIEPIITSAVDLIRSSLGPTIVIETDLQTPGQWVLSDPHQLELALLNLAINARDAMPEGGLLRIESSMCSTRLSASTGVADYASICVIDTGCGMSSEVLAKAVEPFFTTKPQGKGTGLGLSQVYGFLGQSRGELRIASEPGQGTRIELLLPVTDAVTASGGVDASTAEPDANQPDKRALLLVIDDDDGVRRIIVEALLDAGFDVIEASDGPSGLAHLEHAQPAAAVIDFLMPGMNG